MGIRIAAELRIAAYITIYACAFECGGLTELEAQALRALLTVPDEEGDVGRNGIAEQG